MSRWKPDKWERSDDDLRRLYEDLADVDRRFNARRYPLLKDLFTNALGAMEDLQRAMKDRPDRKVRGPRPRRADPMEGMEERWKLPRAAAQGGDEATAEGTLRLEPRQSEEESGHA